MAQLLCCPAQNLFYGLVRPCDPALWIDHKEEIARKVHKAVLQAVRKDFICFGHLQ
jgi:hypothetical protein